MSSRQLSSRIRLQQRVRLVGLRNTGRAIVGQRGQVISIEANGRFGVKLDGGVRCVAVSDWNLEAAEEEFVTDSARACRKEKEQLALLLFRYQVRELVHREGGRHF